MCILHLTDELSSRCREFMLVFCRDSVLVVSLVSNFPFKILIQLWMWTHSRSQLDDQIGGPTLKGLADGPTVPLQAVTAERLRCGA